MVNITELVRQINDELQRFSGAVKEDIDKAAKEAAEKAVETLKVTSPKDTVDYRKGWTYRKLRGKYIVHNKTDYQLTHLLEKSHVLRNGGRSRPQVHIKPVEEQAIEDFVRKVEDSIRGN